MSELLQKTTIDVLNAVGDELEPSTLALLSEYVQTPSEAQEEVCSRRYGLYRLFDAAGRLLYVGLTLNPFKRLHEHNGSKSWWRDVVSVEIDHIGPMMRNRAEAIERAVIVAEQPIHNTLHTGRPERRSRNTSSQRVDIDSTELNQ